MYQRRLVVLVVTALAALLVSSCGGGGGSQEEEGSAADTTTTTEDTEQAITTGGGNQAPEDALNAALEQSFSESGTPGVVAAVQIPEYTWVETRGVADLSSEEPMTLDVHQRIGSVTKTFTGTLLLQAEAQGLLSLDDTIDQYYEDIPNGDMITLRQMANMTSGIARATRSMSSGRMRFSPILSEFGRPKSLCSLVSKSLLRSIPAPSFSTPTRTRCCSVSSSSR
jgi:D-alanyl-D-alanine carboxypeptidase